MFGFDIEESIKGIENIVNNYFKELKKEIITELKSESYKDIFKSVELKNDIIDFKLEKGVDLKNQDFIQVLAYGGVIKKNKDFIKIKPSITIQKYLGRRK